MTGLKAIAAKHKAIGDVRGLGAMVAVELFKNGDLHQPDADLTKRVCVEALKRGLVMLSCGSYANVLRILVPLTVPQAQLEEGLKILAEAFDAAVSA
jgi:4-aminobutyrate aminotransferase-like enzyme